MSRRVVMMMMAIKRVAAGGSLLLIALLAPRSAWGQQQDFQSWWEVELKKGFGNDFTLSCELEQRFKNNSLQYDRSQVTLAGEYDITDFLEIAAGSRSLLSRNKELMTVIRYRVHADLTGKYAPSALEFTFRTRVQYGFDDMVTFNDWSENKLVNRNRVKAAHHIFGTRLGWFIFLESWHQLNDDPRKLFYRMRYSAGLTYNLNFSAQVGLRYILEDEFNVVDPLTAHILVIGYYRDL